MLTQPYFKVIPPRFVYLTILCISLFLTALQSFAAVDNKGTEFIIAYNPNFDSSVIIEMHLTSDIATSVTINYPMNTPVFTDTVAVTPGNITVVTLPIQAANSGFPDTTIDNAVHAVAAEEFVA